MKQFICTLLLASFLLSCKTQHGSETASTSTHQNWNTHKTLQTIAFGSCNRQYLDQSMWQYILQNEPDIWIWMGDNIYADTKDMNLMAMQYDTAKSNPLYQQLLHKMPVVGIWDDHDYGVNDGDKAYPMREESKKLMLDFLDVPKDAPVRQYEGAYQSYTFGKGNKKVKILLLDTRYFRDELEENPARHPRYLISEEGDILGEAQWQWLEKELTNSDAQLHLLVSGIQIIPEEHAFEKWANFPKARKRLFDLLVKTQPQHAILLSGDRHIAEVSKMELDELDYALYDITSSGLTHSYKEAKDEPNRFRVSRLIGERNFGLLYIDWTKEGPIVRTEIRGLGNNLHDAVKIEW